MLLGPSSSMQHLGSNITSSESDVNICLKRLGLLSIGYPLYVCLIYPKKSKGISTKMHHMDTNKIHKEKDWWKRHKNAVWTNPGGNTPQNNTCTTIYRPSQKPIQIREVRQPMHNWRRKDKFISDVLLWTTTQRPASVGRPARTYKH